MEKMQSLIDIYDSLKRDRLSKTAFPALPLFSCFFFFPSDLLRSQTIEHCFVISPISRKSPSN